MAQGTQPPQGERYQVFVIDPNDFLRTPGGKVRYFTSIEEARRAAADHGGFVQAAGDSPPGGFDRSFGQTRRGRLPPRCRACPSSLIARAAHTRAPGSCSSDC